MAKDVGAASAPSSAPDDRVGLHHPDATGCSYDGTFYAADANGFVWVPEAAADPLLAHGFVKPSAKPAGE